MSFRHFIEVVACITNETYCLNLRRPDVAEVCMDEGAVSSNALESILLDGGVVKDWCKRTFHSVALVLRDICIHLSLFVYFKRFKHGFLMIVSVVKLSLS